MARSSAEGSLAAARSGLQEIGALDPDGRITDEGRRLRALPLPPRLARMVLKAGEHGNARAAAEIAAILVERGIGGNDIDLAVRLDNFRRDRSQRAENMRSLSRQWARTVSEKSASGEKYSLAALLALAYPERIAKNRGKARQLPSCEWQGRRRRRKPEPGVGAVSRRCGATRARRRYEDHDRGRNRRGGSRDIRR